MASGIYIIRNLVNGKFYIGQAQNLKERWQEHRSRLRGDYHVNKHIQRSWNKYGESAFEFDVLVHCSIDELNTREQEYLDIWVGTKECYNIAREVGTTRGLSYGLEHRMKLSSIKKKIMCNPEVRAKISAANKGRKLSPETRAKISAALIARSPELKAKIAMFHKGRKRNDETKAKISAALSGTRNPGFGKPSKKRLFNSEQIEQIEQLLSNGIVCARIAEMFGVSRATISAIKRGKIYKKAQGNG